MATPLRHVQRLVLACVAVFTTSHMAMAQTVTVFAAASLKPALDEITKNYEAVSGHDINLSYAGSSALARQIQHGAPAQVFLSANTTWMDALEANGLLADGTRRDLLRNQLALIARVGSDLALSPEPGAPFSQALGDHRLAVALTRAVPAGIYAREALTHLGLWNDLQHKLAQADNVTAALRLVALGEAPLGIVYATDATANDQVELLGLFPDGSHSPIVYPVALTREGDSPEARAFLEHLSSPQASDTFQTHGFGLAKEGQ
ncbi:Molybdate-binding periplasmic protein precursor [Falsiruegeria litorea R37]|uniref:Molybdate-binding periplasmic protein n=1 Tax=Falsiruegeria litorea R37 TaxID=1200284 RepID=A0A1Y5S1T1_9RHOB|nr:molybdate ABC transporter substrate-binding protein [Falsiruegeria litorea]SLN30136.1 Molybdate-binding periplasmic protein precursor [Falsiruegeria litorea R37]